LASDPDIGGVLVEPMVGREGLIPAPAGWLREISDLCRRHAVALIADEIFTGFGRTGAWFAVEADGVQPDLLCCGKALAGGLPIGAVLGRRGLMDAWRGSHEALHTATFIANPLSCASALAVLEILDRQHLPERAANLGRVIAARAEDWSELFGSIVEVRGLGLAWGIELASSGAAHTLLDLMLRDGIVALGGGPEGRVVQICPPLVITDRQLAFALDSIETRLRAI
jgi:4-aminobutyrate aminotransferase-like enzyme